MKDWDAYSETVARSNEISVGQIRKPNVFEYGCIKTIDGVTNNGLIIVAFLICGTSALAAYFATTSNPELSKGFMDMFKLSGGVLIGALSQKGKK